MAHSSYQVYFIRVDEMYPERVCPIRGPNFVGCLKYTSYQDIGMVSACVHPPDAKKQHSLLSIKPGVSRL
jgi:hypothetical protein